MRREVLFACGLIALSAACADPDSKPNIVEEPGDVLFEFDATYDPSTGAVTVDRTYPQTGRGLEPVLGDDGIPSAVELSATLSYDASQSTLSLYALNNTPDLLQAVRIELDSIVPSIFYLGSTTVPVGDMGPGVAGTASFLFQNQGQGFSFHGLILAAAVIALPPPAPCNRFFPGEIPGIMQGDNLRVGITQSLTTQLSGVMSTLSDTGAGITLDFAAGQADWEVRRGNAFTGTWHRADHQVWNITQPAAPNNGLCVGRVVNLAATLTAANGQTGMIMMGGTVTAVAMNSVTLSFLGASMTLTTSTPDDFVTDFSAAAAGLVALNLQGIRIPPPFTGAKTFFYAGPQSD